MKSAVTVFFLLMVIEGVAGTFSGPVQTIRGVVKDQNTQEPLPGANIILLDIQPLVGTTSDAQGRFRLEGVPVGRVGLRVSFVGYREKALRNVLLTSGKELFLEISLEEMIVEGEEVQVLARHDKSNAINKMALVSARGFSVEETGRYAGSLNDVARMASNFAGVVGVNDARNDIIIRGNTPMGLLWRLDDVDIPNPNHWGATTSSGGPVCMLNNNVLDNSDFLTAAFPARFGNALSGVFDLKMRHGNDERHEFLGQVGFNGFEFGAEGPLGPKNGPSYLINMRYSTLEVMKELGADLGTGAGIPMYKDFSAKIRYPNSPLGQFSFFAMGGISDIRIWDSERDTTEDQIDLYGGEGYDLTSASSLLSCGLSNTYTWSPKTYSKLTLSGSFHQYGNKIDSLKPETLLKIPTYRNDFGQNWLSLSFQVHHRLNQKNNGRLGFDVRHMKFTLTENMWTSRSQGMEELTDYQGSSALIQAFAEWNYHLSDRTQWTGGLHFMHFQLNKRQTLEPRVGLRHRLSATSSLNLGAGWHALLNPVTVYFRQTLMANGSWIRLNEDLPMIQSLHLVAGYDWNPTEVFRIKIETYLQSLSNIPVNGGARDYYALVNQGADFGFPTPDTLVAGGSGLNRGLELTAEHFLNQGMYFLFTASVFDSRYRGSDGVLRHSAFDGGYVLNFLIGKEWLLSASAKKTNSAQRSIALDFKSTWAGNQRFIPSDVIQLTGSELYGLNYRFDKAFSGQYPAYSRTDLKLTFRINGMRVTQEWSLDIQNLLDTKNIYNQALNKKTGEKYYTWQVGRLVIPQYRIIF